MHGKWLMLLKETQCSFHKCLSSRSPSIVMCYLSQLYIAFGQERQLSEINIDVNVYCPWYD